MTADGDRETPPTDAVEAYLKDKRVDGLSEQSIRTYRQHLDDFLGWCDRFGIEEMGTIDMLAWKDYRADLDRRVADSTRSNRLGTARRLLEFCADLDAVDRAFVERIDVEHVTNVRDDELEADTAAKVLGRVRQFHYASRLHVIAELLWSIGCRVGTLRAFDVDDVHAGGDLVKGERVGPHIRAKHRPETETPLKNGENAERPIALGQSTMDAVQDYVDHVRPDVRDEFGRQPLVVTSKGRASKSLIRTRVYRLTQPCWRGEDCPEGKAPADCAAAQNWRDARLCPDAVSPHAMRRGRLTDYTRDEIPDEVIEDRADVSADVLEEHYNTMEPEERMEQRREYFEGL